MILSIDTTKREQIEVKLINDSEVLVDLTDTNRFGSQVLMKLIEEVLETGKVSYQDISAIEVATGPGSFTGLRVGVSVANALAFSLAIPVNGKKLETALVYNQ